MAVQVSAIAIIFGIIFRTSSSEFVPFLAAGVVFWGFISTSITDGSGSLINSDFLIKQTDLPFGVYVIRTLWRNLIALFHNILLIPAVSIIFGLKPTFAILLLPLGVAVLCLNLSWIILLLGIASARFRDIPPMVTAVLNVAFYVTPVMWMPNLLGDNKVAHLVLGLNPLYHWLQIVRLPAIGGWPTAENWLLSIASAIVGGTIALIVLAKNKNKIAYWV
jgi:lipopolysaccharide transport system permease protein